MSTLIEQINIKLESQAVPTLVKKLGYHVISKGMFKLNSLLTCKELKTWLTSAHYDYVHTNRTFLIALCEILLIEQHYYVPMLNMMQQLDTMKTPYLFVETYFKRANEPIFALAMMESKRRVALPKEAFLSQSDESIEAYVARCIKQHYEASQGYIKMWGKIHLYILFHPNGKKYIFNVNGCLLVVETYNEESEAFLRHHQYTFQLFS